MPQYTTLADAAARWAVSTRTIRRRIATGELPAVRLSARAIRINEDDLASLFKPVAVAR